MKTFDIVFICIISFLSIVSLIILYLINKLVIEDSRELTRIRTQREAFNLANWPSNSTTLYPPHETPRTQNINL